MGELVTHCPLLDTVDSESLSITGPNTHCPLLVHGWASGPYLLDQHWICECAPLLHLKDPLAAFLEAMQPATPLVLVALLSSQACPESSHLPGGVQDLHIVSQPHCDEPVRTPFEQMWKLWLFAPRGCLVGCLVGFSELLVSARGSR